MVVKMVKPPPPSEDKRWKLVDVTMRRNGYYGHSLIETLHSVQDAFGFLDDSAMRYVAQSLSLPLSRVYGVATFYHLFTLKPKGKHTCVVCTGTACYIKGSPNLLADGTVNGRIAGMNPGHIQPLFMRNPNPGDDLIQMHLGGIGDGRGGIGAADQNFGHQRTGVEDHRTFADQALALDGDQFRVAGSGADEINGHGSESRSKGFIPRVFPVAAIIPADRAAIPVVQPDGRHGRY